MIVIVAPYSPAALSKSPHLGAARKIEAVISLLSQFDSDIVLVNSAHNEEMALPMRLAQMSICGVPTRTVTPRTFVSRPLGKFLNIADAGSVVNFVLQLGDPALVWLYNGYAFEARFAKLMHKKRNCAIVEELEDWHFSRGRGINPKPYLDYLFWRIARSAVSYTFAVNSELAKKSGKDSSRTKLFPGVAAGKVIALRESAPPFPPKKLKTTVGYFGGLSKEKGAHRILEILDELDEDFEFIVTGAGALNDDFEAAARRHGNLKFHGAVDEFELMNCISQCDVVLNPHSSIEGMGNGVFPFKVIEAIASGRLVISTPLPSEGLRDVLSGVCFVGDEKSEISRAILRSRQFYETQLSSIREGADAAALRFGERTLLERIRSLILERK